MQQASSILALQLAEGIMPNTCPLQLFIPVHTSQITLVLISPTSCHTEIQIHHLNHRRSNTRFLLSKAFQGVQLETPRIARPVFDG